MQYTRPVDTCVQTAVFYQGVSRLGVRQMDCVFCTAPATQLHHVFPIAARSSYNPAKGAKKPRANVYKGGWTVPSCGECNRLLGAKVFEDPQHACRYVARQLKRKHARLLAMPEWEDWELSELKGSLKQSTLTALRRKRAVKARIAYAERIAKLERECLQCKSKFTPLTPWARFCKDKCRRKHHREMLHNDAT